MRIVLFRFTTDNVDKVNYMHATCCFEHDFLCIATQNIEVIIKSFKLQCHIFFFHCNFCFGNGIDEFIRIKWLQDIVKRTEFDGFDGKFLKGSDENNQEINFF